MIRVSTAYVDEYNTLWISKKSFANKMAQVVANTAEIDALIPQTMLGTKGSTQQKQQYLDQMLDATNYLIAAGSSYAVDAQNAELHAQLNLSASDLIQGTHQACLGRCRAIPSLLQPYADKLGDYGVEPAHFTAQEEACTAFTAVLAKPVSSRKDISNANEQIKMLIDETTLLFVNHIDKLVKMMAKDQPVFYKGYKNARVIGGSSKASNDPAVDSESV